MKYQLLIALLLLAGCQDRFRYACQSPDNWEQTICKRPICSSSGTCPDQLATPEIRKPEEEQPR